MRALTLDTELSTKIFQNLSELVMFQEFVNALSG